MQLMRVPVLLAHGEGLISHMGIALLTGAIGLVSLIVSGVAFFYKTMQETTAVGRAVGAEFPSDFSRDWMSWWRR